MGWYLKKESDILKVEEELNTWSDNVNVVELVEWRGEGWYDITKEKNVKGKRVGEWMKKIYIEKE